MADKIRGRIADAPFYANEGEIHITASFGVAEFGNESEINQVLKAADEAVYAAKKKGRNRIETEGGRSCPEDIG